MFSRDRLFATPLSRTTLSARLLCPGNSPGKNPGSSHVRLFATPRTVAYRAPPSMGNYRQEYWNGLPFPSPGEFPDPGMEPGSPALQADALASEPQGKQEYRSGWLFPSPGDLPHLQIKQCPLQCRHILYYLSHQGSPYITLSAMEIVEMSGKFKLCFLEYHGIFFPNIFQRVDCIFFSPNIKFLAMATHSSENPRDGGAWWAAVYGVTQSWTRLKRLSSSSSKYLISYTVSN